MRKRFDITPEEDLGNGMIRDIKRNKNGIHSVPFYIGICVLVYLLGIYGAIYIIDNDLPTALTANDEQTYPDAFIAERAIHDLKLLTSLGPRITGGYENEVLAVDILMRAINYIIHQANSNQILEVDVQTVSGAYNLDLLHVDQINVYANVQNVVVKLHGRNNSTHSVLVNSHFDSVPTSPGGSDDGINVVAMLEVLRKLSKSSEILAHNVIFLFNGAEETPLQASHGFITQHKWAEECKVVVNLEACGAGGKIILFQSGPETPWLMKYYNMVPHPYGQAAGEEIFQTGWIPSDTDFRIFRDFGGLVGVDMAFFKNGYRYHTKFDDFQNIPKGSYQHVGNNVLALIKNLANAPELLDSVPTPGKMVYFDVLGWFMISYTTFTAAVLNSLVILMSASIFLFGCFNLKLGFSKANFKYLAKTFGCLLGGWILSGIFLCIVAYFLDILNSTMSWYANPWLIIGLYVAPTIALSGCLLLFVNQENLSLNIQCQIQAHLVRIIWTLIFFVGTILNVRAMYALMIPILFNSVAFILIQVLQWQHTIRKWQIVYFTSLIIPTVSLMYQMLITLSMFIPLTGRIGSSRNPDIIIGLMVVMFTILITSPYVALIPLLRNSKFFFICLGLVFLTFLIIVFTPLGFPYRGDSKLPAPQRHWLLHTKRVFHNETGEIEKTDAGIFFLNLDRNSPGIIKNYVKDIANAKPLAEDCNKYLLCGLPLSHSKMIQIMEYSTWIPANQPLIREQFKFTVNSKEQINSTFIRYNVSASGSDRLGIYLVPKTNVKLVNLSLIEFITQPDYSYKNRQLFFILFAYGKDPADLTFTFEVKVPSNHNGSTVDIAVIAKYVHGKKITKTPYYLKILQQFPDWTDVTPWLGVYSLYVV